MRWPTTSCPAIINRPIDSSRADSRFLRRRLNRVALAACLAGGLLLGGVAACASADRAAQESFELAEFEERQGNVEHARQLYQEILNRYPQSEWAHKAKGRLETLPRK